MSVFAIVASFFVACDGGYNNDAAVDASSSPDIRFADVGVGYDAYTDDALLFSQHRQGFVPKENNFEEEGWYDPGDPPLEQDDVDTWYDPRPLCKSDNDCPDDDGDLLTEFVGCDQQSHRCIYKPPEGCYTLFSSGEIHGNSENLDGDIPDPSVTPWPSCPSGNCHHFTYCPGWRWDYVDSINTFTGQWATDRDSCPQGQIDYSAFVGGQAALDEAGCTPICYGSSNYDPAFKKVLTLQCSAYYLPPDD